MSVHSPARLEDLWSLLHAGALPLAGGTDLLVKLRHRPGPWPDMVRLDALPELTRLEAREGGMFLGAACPVTRVLRHDAVRERLPLLANALGHLGSTLIRNAATLGGNLATASPAGDSLPALLALDAALELRSDAGARCLGVHEFLLGPGRTALGPGEIVAGVFVPWPVPGGIQHFEKVGGRQSLAIAVASLAASIELDAQGLVRRARLALGSVAPTAVLATRAAAMLEGRALSAQTLRRAGEVLREEIAPQSDLRATAEYRSQVAGRLLWRLAGRS